MNKELRKKIIDMVCRGGDGHIPSAFSILDIINYLYDRVLKFKSSEPNWSKRDYFILSKGHGCLALYVILEKKGFIKKKDINLFCKNKGILGEHPDITKVPGIEASTGSLGHGLSFGVGLAKGLKIRKKNNKVFVLVGDGECHEGTVWEAANVAKNHNLNNLIVVVDFNSSASQLLPYDKMEKKWKAFGWKTKSINGHSIKDFRAAFDPKLIKKLSEPYAIIANTVKGKGIKMIEGHGIWHHKIPNKEEYNLLIQDLNSYYGR